MNKRNFSLLGFLVAVTGVFYLFRSYQFFANNNFLAGVQVIAFATMIWARITFGMRSFHAGANTTKGKLIKSGPYRWVRHPIIFRR